VEVEAEEQEHQDFLIQMVLLVEQEGLEQQLLYLPHPQLMLEVVVVVQDLLQVLWVQEGQEDQVEVVTEKVELVVLETATMLQQILVEEEEVQVTQEVQVVDRMEVMAAKA
jgi:hypothetical protein